MKQSSASSSRHDISALVFVSPNLAAVEARFLPPDLRTSACALTPSDLTMEALLIGGVTIGIIFRDW
ncbi:hypothetical protein OROGR_020191 [Orobanche gracilis]